MARTSGAWDDYPMPSGDVARTEVASVLSAMRRGELVPWTDDYRCPLSGGSSLQIQVTDGDRLIRAVVFDESGALVDATESAPNPSVSYAVGQPIHRLRRAVEEQLRRA
jgi:hypothetical protein